MLSAVLTLTVAVAGPSVMEPSLPGRPGQPPWAFNLQPPASLAVALTAAALAAGTVGLGLSLRAAHRNWTISPRLLLAAGLLVAAVLALTPPFGSADHLSYAAYGRMVVTGHDPYTTTPGMLAVLGDPVARAVQDWRNSPSVYGSLATGGEALASLAGGSSVRLTVFVLSVINLVAFAGTGLLLHRFTRGSRERQYRAALLWAANPLLLQVLVAGGHVDTQAIVFGVAAVVIVAHALRRIRAGPSSPGPGTPDGGPGSGRAGDFNLGRGAALSGFAWCAAAGAVAGLGFAIKVSMILVPVGMVAGIAAVWWARWRRLAVVAGGLAAGFAVTGGAAFVPWGLTSLKPALHAGSYVSIGSPWRAVRSALRLLTGEAVAGDLVKAGAIMLMLVLLALFGRALVAGRGVDGAAAGPAPSSPAGGSGRDTASFAAAGAFAVIFAWLVAWPYVLPWYDGLAWALLAMVPVSATRPPGWPPPGLPGRPAHRAGPWAAFDWLLLARTSALAFGYLPARGITMPSGLDWLRTVVRTGLTPVVLLAVTVLTVMLLRRRTAERAR